MQTNTLTNQNILSHFWKVLESLSEKERNVIERRIGITGSKETLQSIGNSFKPAITRERVRQIKEKALRRLRKSSKSKILKSYLG